MRGNIPQQPCQQICRSCQGEIRALQPCCKDFPESQPQLELLAALLKAHKCSTLFSCVCARLRKPINILQSDALSSAGIREIVVELTFPPSGRSLPSYACLGPSLLCRNQSHDVSCIMSSETPVRWEQMLVKSTTLSSGCCRIYSGPSIGPSRRHFE